MISEEDAIKFIRIYLYLKDREEANNGKIRNYKKS